ncbi:hypothetical protein BCR44DRAFT_1429970 [Catenaria anguillulae PL171]|uniref:Phosphatidic acid phosphatase type 2/haloperoxidase domain-containing protein n=1 Tax=Catenaria anguillulae PL171 TaxID=765915 RepID=A0A1Y2HT79_9FUNG|nr:hypothetical protein BCR44DRAFT_1429970 [Catenaria anguillulae PL171]
MPDLRSLFFSIQPAKALQDGVGLLPLLLLSLALIFSRLISPFQRLFNPLDPTIAFPHADPDTVSNPALVAISTIYPGVVLVAWAWKCKFSLRQGVIIGRLRPDFLDRCKPVQDASVVGGWRCTGEKKLVDGGRVSFPSGTHPVLTFSGGFFLVLFLYHTLTPHLRRNAWLRTALILLMVPALLTTVSRLTDYRHHPEDVIAGALLGMVLSWYWYRTYFTTPSHCHASRAGPLGAPVLDVEERSEVPQTHASRDSVL